MQDTAEGEYSDNLKSYYSSFGMSTADVAAPGGDFYFRGADPGAQAIQGQVLSTWPEGFPCLRSRRDDLVLDVGDVSDVGHVVTAPQKLKRRHGHDQPAMRLEQFPYVLQGLDVFFHMLDDIESRDDIELLISLERQISRQSTLPHVERARGCCGDSRRLRIDRHDFTVLTEKRQYAAATCADIQ